MKRTLLFGVIFGLFYLKSAAQEIKDATYTDTLFLNNFQTILLPIAYSSPETSFAFGLGGQFFFRFKDSPTEKLSNIFFAAIYTVNNQLILQAIPQLYFKEENYYAEGLIEYQSFPNKFYGIGNDTPEDNVENYNMWSIKTSVSLLRNLPPFFSFGLKLTFNYYEVVETDSAGLMEGGTIKGADKANLSGIGFIFRHDKRDNYYDPLFGHYIYFEVLGVTSALGATHSYQKYTIDFRKYFNLTKTSVIATQVTTELTYGDVPFQGAAWLGGGVRGRGYFKGRFIDDHLYAWQVEYRQAFAKRWRLAGFIGSSEVASKTSNFFSDTKFFFGGGVRFKVKKDNPTLLRADYGIGEDGNSGFYFGVNQAF